MHIVLSPAAAKIVPPTGYLNVLWRPCNLQKPRRCWSHLLKMTMSCETTKGPVPFPMSSRTVIRPRAKPRPSGSFTFSSTALQTKRVHWQSIYSYTEGCYFQHERDTRHLPEVSLPVNKTQQSQAIISNRSNKRDLIAVFQTCRCAAWGHTASFVKFSSHPLTVPYLVSSR